MVLCDHLEGLGWVWALELASARGRVAHQRKEKGAGRAGSPKLVSRGGGRVVLAAGLGAGAGGPGLVCGQGQASLSGAEEGGTRGKGLGGG